MCIYIYIYIYVYTYIRISRDLSQSPHAGLPRAADRASQMQLFFPPKRGGASREQMCDFEINGNVVLTSNYPKTITTSPGQSQGEPLV